MPKYGASREMSQSARPLPPSPSHSCALLKTSGCRRGCPFASCRVQRCRKATHAGSDNRKKKCSDDLRTGVAPEIVEYGFLRSVGAYTAPHTSHESPYWSLAPHFGHSPLMYRSGRNISFTGSKNCSTERRAISDGVRSRKRR